MKVQSSVLNQSYSLQTGFSRKRKPQAQEQPQVTKLLKRPYIGLPENPEQAEEDLEILRSRYLRRPMGNFIDIPV